VKESNESKQIKMVDGDHLICLFGKTVKLLIGKLSSNLQKRFLNEIKIGIICTAYSNGEFMSFIKKDLGFDLIIAKTGVKHLHHKAKNFDIAIYFESNGHGTIYSNEDIHKKIEKLNCFIESSTDSQTLEFMSIFLSMFNRTTGDSLSAMIATEASLLLNNMKLIDVYNIYTELDSLNEKVTVKNKDIFLPNEDDSKLIEPKEVQLFIDSEVEKFTNNKARCFVRPSGTEDIVRIYAEADNFKIVKELVDAVKNFILNKFN
jgi:phosphoacetylglucosamine mutase